MLLLAGDEETVRGASMVYVLVTIGLVFPRESLAKNLSVVEELIAIADRGLGPFVLDVVGLDPSVV